MTPPNEHVPTDTPDRHPNDRLDSWGEIAAYLRRGVRTVRRWEKQEGLPVHRHIHRKSGSVYAFKSELDFWLTHRRPRLNQSEQDSRFSRRSWRSWALGICLLVAAVVVISIELGSPSKNTRAPHIRALAVLPFEDLSHDPKEIFLARVITEELITELTRSTSLRVLSWDSVKRYKQRMRSLPEIARELNVDAVVEGSVQQVGQKVTVDVLLIDARKDRHLWSKVYMSGSGDAMIFQEKTADLIAAEIRSALNLNRLKQPAVHPQR